MEEQNHSEEYKHGSKDDGELSKLNKDWDNIQTWKNKGLAKETVVKVEEVESNGWRLEKYYWRSIGLEMLLKIKELDYPILVRVFRALAYNRGNEETKEVIVIPQKGANI